MAFPSLTLVQSAVGDNGTGSTSVSATWGSTTLQGNWLIATVAYNANGSLTGGSGPSGWREIDDAAGSSASVGIHLYHFLPSESGARSGTETFSLVNSKKAVVIIAEVLGLPPAFPISSGSGFSLGSGTGTTLTTTFATTTVEQLAVVVSGHAAVNVVTFSAPLSPYILANQTSSSGGGAGGTKVSGALLFGEVSPLGTSVAPGSTISASQAWQIRSLDYGRTPPPQASLGVGW